VKRPLSLRVFIPFFLVAGGIAIYSNSLYAPFYFDDFPRIVNNPEIRDFSIISQPWKHRYMGYLTFALNYAMGGLNPAGYRLVNLAIHLTNSLLVFGVAREMLTVSLEKVDEKVVSFVPGLAAALFLVHPVQTEAVTYIAQRFASLATMFYLLSVYSYLRWRLSGQGCVSLWYSGSLISAILGMRTKEIVFTLPVMLFILEAIFFTGSWRKRLLFLLPFFLTMLIIPLEFFLHTGEGSGLISRLGRAAGVTEEGVKIPKDVYFKPQMRVIITYLRLLFYPVNQRLVYDYPEYRSFLSPPVYISMFLHVLSVSSAIVTIMLSRKIPSKRGRVYERVFILASFGILWFYLALSVESTIIPIPHLIFEHRLYLPSVGFFIFISSILYLLFRHKWFKYPVILFFSVVIVFFSIMTWKRNSLWADEVLFWKDNVRKAMNIVAPHYYLGKAYEKRGFYREALEEFNLASILGPTYPEIHLAMAETYERMEWLADALREYETVIQMAPQDYRGYLGLGRCSLKTGDLEKAEENLKKAGMLNPYDMEVFGLWKQLKERQKLVHQ